MHPLLSIKLLFDTFTAERFLVPFCPSFPSMISMKLLHSSMIMTILWFCTSFRKTTLLNRKVWLLNHPFQLTSDLCGIFSFPEDTIRCCNCQRRRSSSWRHVFFLLNQGPAQLTHMCTQLMDCHLGVSALAEVGFSSHSMRLFLVDLYHTGGQHSGKYSFDMFTHLRSSLDSPTWYSLNSYTEYLYFFFTDLTIQDWPILEIPLPTLHRELLLHFFFAGSTFWGISWSIEWINQKRPPTP